MCVCVLWCRCATHTFKCVLVCFSGCVCFMLLTLKTEKSQALRRSIKTPIHGNPQSHGIGPESLSATFPGLELCSEPCSALEP